MIVSIDLYCIMCYTATVLLIDGCINLVYLLPTEVESMMAYSKSDGVTLAQVTCHSISKQMLNATINDTMATIDVEVLANRTYWIDRIKKVFILSCVIVI